MFHGTESQRCGGLTVLIEKTDPTTIQGSDLEQEESRYDTCRQTFTDCMCVFVCRHVADRVFAVRVPLLHDLIGAYHSAVYRQLCRGCPGRLQV